MKMTCDNSKARGKHSKDGVFDCGELNKIIGRNVCKITTGLCKNCIPLYYGKTYEQIMAMEKSVKA